MSAKGRTGDARRRPRLRVGNLTAATYATAYDACTEIAKFQELKRSTKVALRVQSHVACLLVMF